MKEIFLIHDDREGHESRRNILEIGGYAVTAFQRSDQCLELLAKRRPALILMDVLLHGMHGFDLCQEIRKEFSGRELPIIISSELYRGSVFEEEAIRVGAQMYLQRPMPPEKVLEFVNQLTTGQTGGLAA